jgi:hypothetical protein
MFRKMLPELGVNGSLAKDGTYCPARGKGFAKTGIVALPDFVNGRLIEAESLGDTWRQNPAATTSSTSWSTAPRCRISTTPSRCSTTSLRSLLTCRRMPHTREEPRRRATNSKGAASLNRGGDVISGDRKHRMNGFT